MKEPESQISSIEDTIRRIACSQAGKNYESISLDSALSSDLGYDGLDATELIMEIEDSFDIVIPDSVAEKVETLADLASLVNAYRQPGLGKPLVLFKKYRRTPSLQDVGGCPSISVKWIGINSLALIIVSCFSGSSQVKYSALLLALAVLAVAAVTMYLSKKSQYGRNRMIKPEKIERNMTINISGGQIGNLNLGEIIGDLQATLRTVTDQGGDTVAECLKQLAEAIVSSKGLDDSAKAETLDQVKEVASQAATEPVKRNKGVLKSIFATLKSTLSGIKDIASVWVHAEGILNDLFGAS